MGWQRARTDEQKESRRQAILTAATELLAESRPEEVSFNAIARQTGLAKSNLYRYFGSREEILLHILGEDLAEWMEAMVAAVEAVGPEAEADTIAHALAACAAARPRMFMLLGQLAAVLEQNVSDEALYDFKIGLRDLAVETSQRLHAAIPRLTPEHAYQLGVHQFILLQGLWPNANPPEVVKRVMQRPELCAMHVTFEVALEQSLALVLRGMLVAR